MLFPTSHLLLGIMIFANPLFVTIMLSLTSAYCFQPEQRAIQANSTPLGTPWQGKHKVSPEGMDTRLLFITGPPIKASRSLYNTSMIPFQEHNEGTLKRKWTLVNVLANTSVVGLLWLGMQLDYAHVSPLLDELNSTTQPLLSRSKSFT